MNSNSRFALASAVAIAMAACSSQPARHDDLEAARVKVQQVESSPDAGKYASAEVSAAHAALLEADRLAEKGEREYDIQHAAYMASRHADIAAEQIAKGQSAEKSAAAEADRQKVLVQAREQEASVARAQAQASQVTAQNAQRQSADLAEQLRDLQAKMTDRGLVLTLGDVLFDTGQATLKVGADSTVERLATFLDKAPDRSVVIEGHTDNVGTDGLNLALSESRAGAVKAALVAKGVAPDRIVTVGKGEAAPVASNDDAAGRQQNRRVEIIISNPTGVANRG